jgi:hypothetical protein
MNGKKRQESAMQSTPGPTSAEPQMSKAYSAATGLARSEETSNGGSTVPPPPDVPPAPNGGENENGDDSGGKQPFLVQLTRSKQERTSDEAFWGHIKFCTGLLDFRRYKKFMDWIMCGQPLDSTPEADSEAPASLRDSVKSLRTRRGLPFPDVEKYRLLKVSTEAFLAVNCGVCAKEAKTVLSSYLDEVTDASGQKADVLPYLAIIQQKLGDLTFKLQVDEMEEINSELTEGEGEGYVPRIKKCYGLLQKKLEYPCLIELIWSYWHEEAFLVQTLGAIKLRFQNRRSTEGRDPLAQLELDPLRPLNNIIWGCVQDEQHCLTLPRRAYEYLHHYGITLQGRAVPKLDFAESRSKFIEAFHMLLNLTSKFYKQDDDTTVVADGFPVLNGLKEVHLLLSEGAHNQYGDLPWTARQEMMMEQWILARPEFREYLPRRIMVAYPEEWMDSVDSMKRLQGWGQTSVLHYRNLAVFGEQVLLSIRFGAWTDIHDPNSGANWARAWRAEIQSYIHDYRAVTGVDLSADRIVADKVDTQMPSVHMARRLKIEQQAAVR